MTCPNLPTVLKIQFYVGDTHAVKFTIKDQDDLPLNMAGGSGQLFLKSEDGVTLVTVSATILDGANGIVVYEFAPADTNTLEAGAYTYTAKVTTSANKTYTIAVGPLTLLPN